MLLEKTAPEIKIEKNVALPTKNMVGKYAFRMKELEIGDSFVTEGRSKSIRSSIFNAAKRLGMKISTINVNDNDMRTWRTK